MEAIRLFLKSYLRIIMSLAAAGVFFFVVQHLILVVITASSRVINGAGHHGLRLHPHSPVLPQWYLRLNGYEWILLLYGSVWASDSLAYYVGKGMGKRKLYVEVSPNKTVEGAFGSVLGGDR